ncbi:reverse transcriptase domain, Reverse transcriptase zinc-binding domain protein [Artemisia annua]|uniref:Reverse transcriptase domain, Reverse transcriptase zinc-binding domain protein n=1 Tax=Artemisia annua TaxID=35608 RepID=A0A2U1N745_ARTAN|nr:reverse transcriptase domain, Reverse transcriptase zinc-binding domain protein [Artemisia annua]
MGVWEKNNDMVCVFCKSMPDSHNHLFFECDFPGKIWNEMKNLVKLDFAPNSWTDLLAYMLKKPINKSIWIILQRLVIGASIYYVWQERNLRIFQGRHRSFDEVCNLIKDTVRLRVMSLSLNTSPQVFEAASLWQFHVVQSNGRKRVQFSPWK